MQEKVRFYAGFFLHLYCESAYDFSTSLTNKCSCTSLVAAQLKKHRCVVLTRNARRLQPSKESDSNRGEVLQTSGVVSPTNKQNESFAKLDEALEKCPRSWAEAKDAQREAKRTFV